MNSSKCSLSVFHPCHIGNEYVLRVEGDNIDDCNMDCITDEAEEDIAPVRENERVRRNS